MISRTLLKPINRPLSLTIKGHNFREENLEATSRSGFWFFLFLFFFSFILGENTF
jgi:hypothetical protein